MFQSPGPVIFSVGGFSLRWYGVLIGAGILFTILLAARELKKRDMPPDTLYDMGFWVVLSGIIGARLYYVIFQWASYSENLPEILKIWKGGLAIHGALIGGFLAFFAYARMKKINWSLYADIIIPGVALAQALGRWGNFFNNEAFGGPTNLPWKLFIPEISRPKGLESFEYFHPTFLYESLWNLFIFAVLFSMNRQKKSAPGMVFSTYLILYSIGRYSIEGLRTDSLMAGPFRTAQIVSIILFVIGVSGFLFLKKKKALL